MTPRDRIRADRERREAAAKELASTLPSGDYYADDSAVVDRLTGIRTECRGTHWDACLVMLAIPEPDAYGRTGERLDCGPCDATGVEYGETCVTCGGYGWVRGNE